MDSLVCVSVLAFCVTLPSALADPDPGRVPKVYNALITSSQNLAPSKSFPLYQPVYEPYSLQFPPGFYYPDYFKNVFGESSLPTGLGIPAPAPPPPQGPSKTPPTADAPSAPTGPEATVPDADRRQDKPPTPEEGSQPPQQPPQQPPAQSPIPLNEFGLPPAIVPLPGRPDEPPTSFAYDPFVRFPYYPQFDPYLNPYSFQSYPLFPSVYRYPGQPQPQPSPPQQPSEASSEAPSAPPLQISGSQLESTLPPAPSDLDVKNYSKSDPSIPDVPPPPIPNGGLKDEAPKTN